MNYKTTEKTMDKEERNKQEKEELERWCEEIGVQFQKTKQNFSQM